MRIRNTFLIAITALAASSCSGDQLTPPTPTPPTTPVLLRDVVVSSLPSPYYHFEYDGTGRMGAASFASGLRKYDLAYDHDKIAEMRSSVVGNQDKLVYVYDDAGRVAAVKYTDATGVVFTLVTFTYDGAKLTGLERDVRVTGGFLVDKTTTLSYYPDGNVREIIEHRAPIDGHQDEATTVDRFEQYDTKTNVEGFSLLHDDFFDHLILLPGVQLQKGNPGRQTRTGDGVNYTADYTYTYDDKGRPLAKSGNVTLTNGATAGQKVQTLSTFSYY